MNRLMHLPAKSRVWIFQADRLLTSDEMSVLGDRMIQFQREWKTHGSALSAGCAILYDLFAIFAVDESVESPSGCSIDKAFRLLKDFGAESGVDFFNRLRVAWPEGESVYTGTKQEVADHIRTGRLNLDSLFFDNSATTLNDLENDWLKPMRNAWFSAGITGG
jgi:hypothetical protein